MEHIVPYSVSLNDSIRNKTLCLADENRIKGDRTPFQFYGSAERKWEEVKNRAYKLFKTNYFKYKRFVSKDIPDLEDFISRQLNDTRYISKVAKEYLSSITHKVDVTQGSVTALLRHYWGLDTILNKPFEVTNFDDGDYYATMNAVGNLIEILKWNYETKKSDLSRLAKKGRVIEGYISESVLYPYKTRDDHKHHAIDALTVALTKRS